MHIDEEGFWYPEVDIEKCIDCSLCEKVCPFLDNFASHVPLKTLGIKNKITNRRLESSSGGLFSILAEYVLSCDGAVCGAAFNESLGVCHIIVEDTQKLRLLLGSKYVQSEIGDTYKNAEVILKNGRQLLYTGTPCQIKGLKKFLRKDYKNLITVEIVCHGVPSPYIWQKFLSTLHIDSKAVGNINFRAKQIDGYDWRRYGFVIKDKYGKVIFSDEAKSTIYFQLYLSDLISRPSCYACNAKNGTSDADFTIGDFWGIETALPDFYDESGVSLMLIHSEQGYEIFKKIKDKLDVSESEFNTAISHNPSYVSSVLLPKEREKFWDYYFKYNDLEYALKKTVYPPYYKMLLSSFKHKIYVFFKL